MPSDWNEIKLGEIADFRNGINYTKESFGNGVKVIGVKDFQDYSVPLYDEIEEINPQGVIKANDLLQQGDILFVRSNGNRELIGRSLFIDKIPEPLSHSGFTIRVRFTSSNVEPKYYSYVFRSRLIRDVLSAYGGGTNISNLNQQILSGLIVPIPPLPVQRKIADVLSAYDDLIEVNTRRIRILEQMAQSVYREWFGKVNGKSLPEEWELVKVGNRFRTALGGTPSRERDEYWQNGTIPWINSSKCNQLRIIEPSEYITELGLNNSSTKLMPKRTTVVAITGATLGQLSLTEIETCANQSIVGIWDADNLFTEYIYLTFREIIQEVIQHAGGSAQQHINKEIVNAVKIIVPPKGVVQHFQEIVKPIFDLLANLTWKNVNLRRTRDLLLPRLVSGEIELELDNE